MKLNDIILNLEQLLPKTLSEEWDNDGVMFCLDRNAQITKTVLTLDVTRECIEFARESGAELIISHHPFIFKPLCSIDESLKSEMIEMLVHSKISVLSYHTRFDNIKDGMNDALAETLGLENISEFEQMGRIGELSFEFSPEEFAAYVCECLDTDTVLYSAGKKIKKVSVLGGGGKDFVFLARLAGADAIVTGDMSHGVVMSEVPSGITVVDAGHYGTEKIFTEAFLPFLERAGVASESVLKYQGKNPGVFVCKEK